MIWVVNVETKYHVTLAHQSIAIDSFAASAPFDDCVVRAAVRKGQWKNETKWTAGQSPSIARGAERSSIDTARAGGAAW